jgi:hypothetical protein
VKRQKVDGTLQRRFLAALANSRAFVAGSAHLADPELFPARAAKLVAGWALEHWGQYREPAGVALRAMMEAWAEREQPDETERELTSDLVDLVLDEAEEANAANITYLLDEFGRYLNDLKVDRLVEELQSLRAAGRGGDAAQAVQAFRTVAVGESAGYSPALSRAAYRRAWAEPAGGIIDWPTGAAWFFNKAMTRDALVGVQAPEKTGKTFVVTDVAYWAVRSHLSVAVFQCGDLSEHQMTKRWAARVSRHPLRDDQCDGVVQPPVGIKLHAAGGGDNGKVAEVIRGPAVRFPGPLDERTAYKAQKAFNRTHKIDKDRPTLMFSVHPNSSINVKGIDGILQRWRTEMSWTPDVIVIDYADILAPEDPRKDSLVQINDTWKALRRLSQEWHACVVTPTQANAAAYRTKLQRKDNFSGNKLKNAHVTGMMGLNQTDRERAEGVMRMNWLFVRDAPSLIDDCLWVATCFPLGYALGPTARG